MNKTKFLELVKNPDTIEEKDLTKLDELISEHPYSQIFHILNVKGKKIYNHPDFEQSLNLAATYSYDRALLKSIIDGINFVPETNSDTSDAGAPVTEEKELDEVPDFSWIQEGADEDDIFIEDQEDNAPLDLDNAASEDDIFEDHQAADSENLGPIETKEISTARLIEEESSDTADEEVSDLLESDPELESTAAEAITEITDDQDIEASTSEETETTITGAQSQPESAIVSADNDPEKLAAATPEDETSEEQSSKPNKPTNDPLETEIAAEGIHAELMKNLSDLKEKRQNFEKKPDTNGTAKSQQEQTEIIDNFIRNSPVLSVPNLSADSEGVSQDDLSKNSTKFTDDMASENLARIYVKQGKRKDAEKIYKKLMVKFPQKKAYFADRIQKLKKK